MIGGLIIEFGWCGCGFSGGLFPEVRCGLVRVCCYRGALVATLIRLSSTLRSIMRELSGRA